MLLQPNDSWRWFLGEDRRLMLELGEDMIFATGYFKKNLLCNDGLSMAFSVEDTGLYYIFLDRLSALGSPAQRVQMALNGVAVARFYKPLMPQSWFFTQQADYHQPQPGEVIGLESISGRLSMMVVETSVSASVCISLSAPTELSDIKSLPTFGAIKVMNDRLVSLEWEEQQRNMQAKRAG